MSKASRQQKHILDAIPEGRSITHLAIRVKTNLELSDVHLRIEELRESGLVAVEEMGRDKRRWRVSRKERKRTPAVPKKVVKARAPKPKKEEPFAPLHNETVVELRTITPAIANKLLTFSDEQFKNRPIKDRNVAMLVRAIENGNWNVDGNTIKLNREGICYDGQHRLWAVVESNKPIETYVMFNGNAAHTKDLDQGRRRSFADYLVMNGYPAAHSVSACVSLKMRYDEGHPLDHRTTFSVGEMSVEFHADEDLFDGAVKYSRRSAVVPGSVATHFATLYAIVGAGNMSPSHAANAHKCLDTFMGILINGTEEPNNPANALRRRLNAHASLRTAARSTDARFALTCKAFNYFVAGTTISSSISFRRFATETRAGESFPEVLLAHDIADLYRAE